jgi:GTP pyrophosphokinase
MAFRYLQPQTYLKLVKSLAETRVQREACINQFIDVLQHVLDKEKISADIAGRPKHLYSISKKMQRKQLDIDELYDLLAVRVIVDKLTNCYAVLGVVHEQWQYIPKEFDDYIANPKANGYQSLHTVVLDQQGHRIEVQIRTREMHEMAELGVAAHWRYKEGGKRNAATDRNIASLRKLLDDKDEVQFLDGFKTELFYDRVYVLTPAGNLIDLAKGSTPLDFAYAIHTQVGHRCRGAKVNGRIVPLTYPLQTGEQVEILTAKDGGPNQQWIDLNLGYLKTPRAIAKVKGWIAQQNFDKDLAAGRKVIDKVALQSERNQVDLAPLVDFFKQPDEGKLLAVIGRGEITAGQLLNAIKTPTQTTPRLKENNQQSQQESTVLVDGISNVETSFAHCCKPVVGDEIIGFITHYKGITIHRKDCENIVHLSKQKQTQLITVSWGNSQEWE